MKNTAKKATRAASAALLLLAVHGGAGFAALGGGGDYILESAVVDNGGGGWMTGGEYATRGSTGQNVTSAVKATGGQFATRSGFYNPPYMTYQKGLPATLSLDNGEVSLTIPANAADREMFEIGINRQSLNQDFLVDLNLVDEANRKMRGSEGEGAQATVQDRTEMYIFDEQSITKDPLEKDGMITLKYRDANNDGIIDGSNPGVRVGTLDAWYLDEKTKLWVMLPSVGFTPQAQTMTFGFRGPGVYNMIGTLATSVDRVFPYPVPFRPNGPNAGTGSGQTGTEADGITFSNVPTPGYAGAQAGEIAVYTLDGKLVRKIDIATNQPVLGKVKWDVKNASGSKVASGVYLWRVTSGSHSKMGKLMIIW